MPPLTYILLLYSVALADEGLVAYMVRGKGLSRGVEELVMHLYVICDDKASVTVSNSVTYGKVLREAVAFFKVGGG